MINSVVLNGRLTKDIDLKYTQSGNAVGSFILAVNRNFTNQSGEREADFVSCVIWRQAAENLANYARKGSLIGIEGRIQTRNYENQQGQRVYVTEVVVEHFDLLDTKNSNQNNNNQNNNNQSQRNGNQNQYNQGRQYQNANQGNYAGNNQNGYNEQPNNFDREPFGTSSLDISDDDLPF